MAALGDDCYFYCTSVCVKGPSCPFRHVESAKTGKIICQHWQMGNCLRPMCKFRHSTFPIPTSTADTPCYWETQPVGCTRQTCSYKHSKPRPQASVDQASGEQKKTASAQSCAPAAGPAVTAQPQTPASQESKEPEMEVNPKTSLPPETKAPVDSEAKAKLAGLEKDEHGDKENGRIETLGAKNKSPAAATKPKTKKVLAKAGAKKNSPVLKSKKIKVVKKAAGKKVVKKSIVAKADPRETSATVKVAKVPKPVKERLGLSRPGAAKARVAAAPPDDRESSSDSDDSVDNIKVLSMEEILRQRALDSMLKKRATEEKPEAKVGQSAKPAAAQIKKVTKKIPTSRAAGGRGALSSAPARPLRREKVTPPVESSETESSTAESESSSDEESGDSVNSASDVRRVVVEVNDEVAARNRAKASLLKRQGGPRGRIAAGKVVKAKDRLGSPSSSPDKKAKRPVVGADYDSDDIISSRLKAPLNIRDRLGKLPLSHAASSSRLAEDAKRAELKSFRRHTAVVKADTSSDEDSDSLEGVKVKTLDQIRQEKMQKAGGILPAEEAGDDRVLSLKQRLGSASPSNRQDDGEEGAAGARHVLLTTTANSGSKSDEASNEAASNEQRKAKKRPWRSKKRLVVHEKEGNGGSANEDERTAVVISTERTLQDSPALVLEPTSAADEVEESPFARLKRRALQKKLQTLQQSKGDSLTRNIVKELDSEERPPETSDRGEETTLKEAEDGEDRKRDDPHKKHKHKHKHKHHKKSKKERQIYMPPALKNAAQESVRSPAREEGSPTAERAAPTTNVRAPPRRGGPHPIAAAWSAGLALSAKGVARRLPLSQPDTSQRRLSPSQLDTSEQQLPLSQPEMSGRPLAVATRRPVLGTGRAAPAELVKKTLSLSSTQPTSELSGTVIKSFSEIMAEKKRRRLELQASKAGNAAVSSSSSTSPSATAAAVTSPVRSTESRPKVPITPIVFNTDSQSAPVVKLKHQTPSTAALPCSQRVSQPPQTFIPEPVETLTHSPSTQETQAKKKTVAASAPRFGRKAVGQKKVLQPQESKEQAASSSSMASLGITIPLPPMTLEEELLLDEGVASSALRVGSSTAPRVETSTAQLEVKLQDENQMPSASSAAPYTPARSSPAGTGAVATVAKHKLTVSEGAETSLKKPRISLDDELALFDENMEDFASNPEEGGVTVEPLDDLLQNIDEFLA